MTDKSQELALALLKDAKEKGTLDPSVEEGLMELIGTEARPKLEEVLQPNTAKAKEIPPLSIDALTGELDFSYNERTDEYKISIREISDLSVCKLYNLHVFFEGEEKPEEHTGEELYKVGEWTVACRDRKVTKVAFVISEEVRQNSIS
jgi:hypothetical protein